MFARCLHCFFVCVGIGLALGCEPAAPEDPAIGSRPDRALPQSAPAKNDLASFAKIKFKDDEGKVTFSLKPQTNGAKLVGADEQEVARFTRDGNTLKVKGPDDAVLGFVVAVGQQYQLKSPEQRELYELQGQADGDWKLKDAGEGLIYRVKPREYGFEIESGADASLFKIKRKGDKTSLRNAQDKTVFYTNDEIDPLAVVPLGFETIDDFPLRAALVTAIVLDLGAVAE